MSAPVRPSSSVCQSSGTTGGNTDRARELAAMVDKLDLGGALDTEFGVLAVELRRLADDNDRLTEELKDTQWACRGEVDRLTRIVDRWTLPCESCHGTGGVGDTPPQEQCPDCEGTGRQAIGIDELLKERAEVDRLTALVATLLAIPDKVRADARSGAGSSSGVVLGETSRRMAAAVEAQS